MHRRMTAAASACLLALGVVAVSATPAGAVPSTSLVINEVYGGGGNSGATFTNDFVEIANRGSAPVAVDGWSVQYRGAGATSTWQSTPLTGSIAPGERYLVAEGQGAGGTTPLPTAQATGTIALSGTAGTVALVSTAGPLTCVDSSTCQAASVDLVGYGTAPIAETAPAAGASNTASVQRLDTADTDNNSTDFAAAAPTPGAANAGGGGGGPAPEPGPLRIHDLQGAGWISPHKDEQVVNVPGVVTAVRTSGSKGFWLQDTTPDANAATSEGIFVFTSAPTVVAGDDVLVSGTVQDFYPLNSGETVSTTTNLSVTEISSPTTVVRSHGNLLPTPELITPTTVPDVYAPDLGGGNIELTPVTPARSALDFWESREGMRVEVDDARVVGPSNDFGEQFVTTKPDQARTYRGGTQITAENAIPSGRVEVTANDGSRPGVNVGDVFTGQTIGVVDYSRFGGYLIAASALGVVARTGPAPVVATPQTNRQLSIATYNVQNLAPGDPRAKYDQLARGIVVNLASPDIIAVEEVQDDTGATDDGVVTSGLTLAKLTTAIEVAGGPHYLSRSVDPVNDRDGGQPGGNIRVVFLFNPSRVSFVDRGPSTVDRSTVGTQVTRRGSLTLSPGRIDPTNPVWTTSRKPLVGEFVFRGKPVIVIGNHFNSKGGDQSADGRFQYPAQSSAVQRAGQAQVVHDFVAGVLAADRRANVVVLGDLNDFTFSPALTALRTGTADGSGPSILTDLISTLPTDQQYTYVFNGVSQVLDHILITRGVGPVDYQVVHINAEYADQVSDHDPQVVRLRP